MRDTRLVFSVLLFFNIGIYASMAMYIEDRRPRGS